MGKIPIGGVKVFHQQSLDQLERSNLRYCNPKFTELPVPLYTEIQHWIPVSGRPDYTGFFISGIRPDNMWQAGYPAFKFNVFSVKNGIRTK